MTTPAQLKVLFDDGKQPDGDDFAALIDSIRSKVEQIPAGEITGLSTLINAAVTAAIGSAASANLDIIVGAQGITITSSTGTNTVIPIATDQDPGLLLPSEKDLLANIITIIDGRIQEAGGVGGGGGAATIVRNVAGSSTYDAAANFLLRDFLIIPGSAQTIKIGTSAGAGDLVDIPLSSTDPVFINVVNFDDDIRTIHFTGTFECRFKADNYAP